jgi:uncharacterized protein (DUF2141 family)
MIIPLRKSIFKMSFVFKIVLMLAISPITLCAQDVEVTIKNIKNNKGQIVIGVFRDEPTYLKEDAFLIRKFVKKDMVNGEMKIRFTMEPGVYGLTLLDDENNSGLMEYNFIGIPKEGFGFSDYYHSGFTKPKFETFKFTLEKGQKKNITIKVRYI